MGMYIPTRIIKTLLAISSAIFFRLCLKSYWRPIAQRKEHSSVVVHLPCMLKVPGSQVQSLAFPKLGETPIWNPGKATSSQCKQYWASLAIDLTLSYKTWVNIRRRVDNHTCCTCRNLLPYANLSWWHIYVLCNHLHFIYSTGNPVTEISCCNWLLQWRQRLQ